MIATEDIILYLRLTYIEIEASSRKRSSQDCSTCVDETLVLLRVLSSLFEDESKFRPALNMLKAKYSVS